MLAMTPGLGGGWRGIPLERDAYELQNWYEISPTQPFSVEQQVIGRLELSE